MVVLYTVLLVLKTQKHWRFGIEYLYLGAGSSDRWPLLMPSTDFFKKICFQANRLVLANSLQKKNPRAGYGRQGCGMWLIVENYEACIFVFDFWSFEHTTMKSDYWSSPENHISRFSWFQSFRFIEPCHQKIQKENWKSVGKKVGVN